MVFGFIPLDVKATIGPHLNGEAHGLLSVFSNGEGLISTNKGAELSSWMEFNAGIRAKISGLIDWSESIDPIKFLTNKASFGQIGFGHGRYFGIIRDSKTKNPIKNADVEIEYKDSGGKTQYDSKETDNDGRFSFDVPGNSYKVNVSKDGYTYLTKKIAITDFNKTEDYLLDIYLTPSTNDTNLSLNGHNYKLFNKEMSWDDAEAYCEARGGHLVTITSDAEQDKIIDMISGSNKESFWAGGQYSEYENDEGDTDTDWFWNNGEQYSDDCDNWGSSDNDPNTNSKMVINNDSSTSDIGAWQFDSKDNSKNKGFICEYENIDKSNIPANWSGNFKVQESLVFGTLITYEDATCTLSLSNIDNLTGNISGKFKYQFPSDAFNAESDLINGTYDFNGTINYNTGLVKIEITSHTLDSDINTYEWKGASLCGYWDYHNHRFTTTDGWLDIKSD